MYKTKRTVVLLGTLLLGGCASLEAQLAPTKEFKAAVTDREHAMQSLEVAKTCCKDFANIPYADMAPGASQLTVIDAKSPVYVFAEGKSYFAAYRLPTHSGDLKITIEGIIDQTMFEPVVVMLDSRFQVTRTMRQDVFKFDPARLISGNAVSGTFTVDRTHIGNPNNESYLLIYTDKSRLDETITIPSDAKLMAKAKVVNDYGIKDPVIPHSPWGVIRFSVTDLSAGKDGGNVYKPAYALGTDEIKVQATRPKVEVAPNKLVVPAATAAAVATSAAVPAKPAPTMLSETEAFYQSQIEKAVKAGDIDKAMQLVNEAERAGSTKAKQVFVDAVKRSQK
ncbi:transcriptional regulator [Aeromonas jandaei]|uniref:MalM family protein n=1 Tax=Aeromonas jandaei TaxID=650 RepID=UPI000F52EF42|nr:MalM family protein [Aeromonas jandaei]RQM72271.1 transcriptional regulator [Aeromonas jandaei]